MQPTDGMDESVRKLVEDRVRKELEQRLGFAQPFEAIEPDSDAYMIARRTTEPTSRCRSA